MGTRPRSARHDALGAALAALLGLGPAACTTPAPREEDGATERDYVAHLSYAVGYKPLDAGWGSAADQVQVGMLDFDFRKKAWPVSLAGQFLFTYESDVPPGAPANTDNSGTWELNLGLRRYWGDGDWQPFLGAGVSVVGASVSETVHFPFSGTVNVQEDHDSTLATWLGGGLVWELDGWFTGLEVHHTFDADVRLAGQPLDAGGWTFSLLFGASW